VSTWADLARELDAWAAAGRVAEFWWRDDDAVAATPALERLVALQHGRGVPLALAVIPAGANEGLHARLTGERDVVVVQHGWAHDNHARPGRSKAELGPDRPAAYVLGELARGQARLDRLFGSAWLKVLVPPHNRISATVADGLSAAGYVGLSTNKPRATPPAGLIQVNVHIDIMDWTVTRAFLGDDACLDQALLHLGAKRGGRADGSEPTGLLTHHLAHDEDAWTFIERFIAATRGHPAVQWRHPAELFRSKMAARSP
jgi:hypothetical protein